MNHAVAQPVSAGPDFSKPYVVLNDDGTWGSAVYHKVRDLHPGVGEFMDCHGGLCEIPLHRMKLVAFEIQPPPPPTPEEKVEAQEKHLYRTRSRKTAPQRARANATDKQVKMLRYLCRSVCLSESAALKQVPRPVKSFSELMLWEASRLIDRLKEV